MPPIATALRHVEAATPGSLEAAAAIAAVLRASTAPADFAAAARFFRDDIASLQTAPDAAAAALFARAALSTAMRRAQRLIASARQAGADEATLAPLDAACWRSTGPRGESATMAMHRRIDAAAQASARARAAARDSHDPRGAWRAGGWRWQTFLMANPPQGGARGESGAMLALASAVERGAVGEGALLAVVAAGEGGPARLDAEFAGADYSRAAWARLEDDARGLRWRRSWQARRKLGRYNGHEPLKANARI